VRVLGESLAVVGRGKEVLAVVVRRGFLLWMARREARGRREDIVREKSRLEV
jgi:hypothetical protein